MCGCNIEEFLRVAELLCSNSGRERTTCIAYALGWTQHSTGVQIIRTAGILQLLLGNMGRPGGGIMALRGHSTIQGATDIATLYDSLPGYLPQPAAHDPAHENLRSYIEAGTMPAGYWSNFGKFMVSLLKAWYGDAATPDNDFGYSWLPRVDGDYSQLAYFDRMSKGGVRGYFLAGQNPAGGGPNANVHRAGLRNLEWLVVSTGSRRRAPSSGRRPHWSATLRDRHRGLLHPRSGRPGKGGQLNQHPAVGAMA